MKLQPCNYFSKVHCYHRGENFASLEPACRIILSNTHLMANYFSVLFLFLKEISQHTLDRSAAALHSFKELIVSQSV